MNILIVNYHSDRNAGDKVLLTVTLQQLRQRFPQAQITVATNDPGHLSGSLIPRRLFHHLGEKNGRRRGRLATWWASCFALWGPLSNSGSPGLSTGLLAQAPVSVLPYPDALVTPARLWRADLIVSCAGNFLYSSGAVGMPFLLAVLSLGYGTLMGKPVYTMPQTIGPLQPILGNESCWPGFCPICA